MDNVAKVKVRERWPVWSPNYSLLSCIYILPAMWGSTT